MTTSVPPNSSMIRGLDALLEATRKQAKVLRTSPYPGPIRRQGDEQQAGWGGQPQPGESIQRGEETGEIPPPPQHTLDDLDLFIGRVSQIKEWLLQDPELLRLVDTHMSQHMRAAEKRMLIQNFWLSALNLLAGAVLGWLFSALASPRALWDLIFH